MRIAITGHRPEKLPADTTHISKWFEEFFANRLQKYGELTIIVGGARGIDYIAAQAAMKVGLDIILALPFVGCNESLNITILEYKKTRLVHVSPKGYTDNTQYWNRNAWMVDHANAVIAYWDGSPGGTSHCVKYAIRAGKKVVNLFERINKDPV